MFHKNGMRPLISRVRLIRVRLVLVNLNPINDTYIITNGTICYKKLTILVRGVWSAIFPFLDGWFACEIAVLDEIFDHKIFLSQENAFHVPGHDRAGIALLPTSFLCPSRRGGGVNRRS